MSAEEINSEPDDRTIVIAIDGPAASGKGTIGRRLAAEYGFAYLDTGLLYRAVGLKMLDIEGDIDPKYAASAAANLVEHDLRHPRIRSLEAGELASQVAAMPEVRQALFEYQRKFAAKPPGGAVGAILDGRDIGSTICPDAQVKLYVTASLEERARRRALEMRRDNPQIRDEDVVEALRARDRRDSQRDSAPMRQSPDAILLNTDRLDIEAAIAQAISIVADRLSQ